MSVGQPNLPAKSLHALFGLLWFGPMRFALILFDLPFRCLLFSGTVRFGFNERLRARQGKPEKGYVCASVRDGEAFNGAANLCMTTPATTLMTMLTCVVAPKWFVSVHVQQVPSLRLVAVLV